MTDPLGLQRCQTCANSFSYDRLGDGTCRHCGGPWGEVDPGPGRPRIGREVKVILPPHVIDRLDEVAQADGISRGEAIRRALEETL